MPYEYLEELAVADVQFKAWGKDVAEVFRSAADATANVMVHDLATIEPKQSRSIELENDALDMLLFNLLQELIYYKDAEGLLLRVADVKVNQTNRHYHLRGTAVGEWVDPARHEQGADIKAVTLHQFRLERDETGWTAYVILDI